jgi:hypothetical protein
MLRRRYTKWASHFPPEAPLTGSLTVSRHYNVQCQGCSRVVDVRPDNLPPDRPWSRVGWSLVCKECGAAGSVNILPNWHDMKGRAVPFSPGWGLR